MWFKSSQQDDLVTLDFQGVPADAVAEVHRQAELYLTQTLAVATAVDSRASTVASMLIGGSVAIAAALAALIIQPKVEWQFVVPLIVAALGFFLAGALSFYSARSVNFYVAGYRPSKLLQAADSLDDLLKGSCEDIERRILINERCLASAGSIFNWGIAVATLTLPISIAAYFAYPYLKGFL